MFQGHIMNERINRLREKCLCVMYSNKISSLQELSTIYICPNIYTRNLRLQKSSKYTKMRLITNCQLWHFPSFQFYWLGVLSMEQKVFPIKAHKSGHSFLRVTKPPFLSTPPFWSISSNLPIKYGILSCKHFQVNLSTNHIF